MYNFGLDDKMRRFHISVRYNYNEDVVIFIFNPQGMVEIRN